jgi:hypothetical protein
MAPAPLAPREKMNKREPRAQAAREAVWSARRKSSQNLTIGGGISARSRAKAYSCRSDRIDPIDKNMLKHLTLERFQIDRMTPFGRKAL